MRKKKMDASPLPRRDSLKRDRHPLYSRSLVVVMGVIIIIIIVIVTQVNGFAEKQYGLSASFLFFLLYFSLSLLVVVHSIFLLIHMHTHTHTYPCSIIITGERATEDSSPFSLLIAFCFWLDAKQRCAYEGECSHVHLLCMALTAQR